ncbi:rab escort protein 1 isoform X2 [Amaranthus tricolor]|uniref:rab escort protein 1 isoform X2 n=1 Tax=Amaranthus tricolor TaxID=29722 RepID=UPI00259104EF|nr:rab escort protein 1 isoform X2 [Amaranthus tricolor]
MASESSPSPPPEFPPVDPTNFDLIVIGTGLPQSIIAAAASTAGKSVLHLDPNPFYGSHFSSLSPPNLSSFILSPPSRPFLSSTISEEFDVLSLTSRSLYSGIEISPLPNELEALAQRFCFDVSGPRVLFCADSAIDLLLKSGVSHYMEFKSVDAVLFYDAESSTFSNVPDDRNAVFAVGNLKLTEKTKLGLFFKLVRDYLSGQAADVISDEDLESPFVDFLDKKLPPKFKRIILYAIALAEYDQENLEVCKDLLKTKDGIGRLALYHSSKGRFPNAPGAMLYPMYGQGELPQAFCRRAAVKGCIYVLRMPVTALLADKGSGKYKGVRLASGQDIFSQQLLIDPNFEVPEALALSRLGGEQGGSQNSIIRDVKKVARGICIARTSLKADASQSDASNLLIVFPPRSLYPEQVTTVRALQLCSNSAVWPVGMFVFHLSTLCDDASKGKNLLTAAMNVLCTQSISETDPSEDPKDNSATQSGVTEEQNPAFIWTALFIQEITEMYRQMFPGDEFFPEIASTDEPDAAEDVPE